MIVIRGPSGAAGRVCGLRGAGGARLLPVVGGGGGGGGRPGIVRGGSGASGVASAATSEDGGSNLNALKLPSPFTNWPRSGAYHSTSLHRFPVNAVRPMIGLLNS